MSGLDFYNTRGGRQFIDGTMPQLVRNVAALNETMKLAFLTDDDTHRKGNDLYHFVMETLRTWDQMVSSQGAVAGDEAMQSMRHVLRELRGLGFHRNSDSADT